MPEPVNTTYGQPEDLGLAIHKEAITYSGEGKGNYIYNAFCVGAEVFAPKLLPISQVKLVHGERILVYGRTEIAYQLEIHSATSSLDHERKFRFWCQGLQIFDVTHVMKLTNVTII